MTVSLSLFVLTFFSRQLFDSVPSFSCSSSFCWDRYFWQSSENKRCRKWALPLHELEGETCWKGTIYISGFILFESKVTIGYRYWNPIMILDRMEKVWISAYRQNEVKSKLKLWYGIIKQPESIVSSRNCIKYFLHIKAKFQITRLHLFWNLHQKRKKQYHQCCSQSYPNRVNSTSKVDVYNHISSMKRHKSSQHLTGK